MKRVLLITLSALYIFLTASAFSQSWTETQKIVASDRDQNDYFGVEVDIDGNHAISGAERKGSNEGGSGNQLYAGAAYIYEFNGALWTEVQKLTNPFPFAYDWFGTAVAISGDYAVVSAHRDDEDENEENYLMNSGSAFIYEKTEGGSWVLVQKITASDRTENAWYGISVAIDGNTIVIGAQYERYDGNGENLEYGAGAAYIYERNPDGTWIEAQKIAAEVRDSDDLFGSAVAVSGDKILVGAYKEDQNENETSNITDAGAGYIFEKNDLGVWNQVVKLVAFDREQYDNFGSEVALEGDIAVIGAWGEDDDEHGLNNLSFAGSAYIFESSSPEDWSFSQKIVASDREADANFGLGVDISGETILAGARFESQDVSGVNEFTNAGAGYFYKKQDDGTWLETQKVVNSDRYEYDYFGQDVGISGSVSIIGAFNEDEDPNGNNTESSAGSAYIFDFVSCTPSYSIETITACDSLIWQDGVTYFESNDSAIHALLDANGCDSIVTLNLTLLNSSAGVEEVSVCDSLVWIDGITYTEPAYNTSFILTNSNGCDSVVSLNLDISYSTFSTDVQLACDSFLWMDGNTYYEPNDTSSLTLINSQGCDSVITLSLTLAYTNTVLGCTYQAAENYNSLANKDDGSCVYSGCTDSEAINFSSIAFTDNGTCVYYSGLCSEGTVWNEELHACVPAESCIGDLNYDGSITAQDLSIFLAAFGGSCE